MRRMWLATATALTAAAGIATWLLWPSDSTPEARPFSLKGQLLLADRASIGGIPDQKCVSRNGYADIRVGATVTVYDATGNAAALGKLDEGSWVGPGVGKPGGQCAYTFTVPNVPDDDILAVEVSSRGQVRVSKSDAEAGMVYLSLGE